MLNTPTVSSWGGRGALCESNPLSVPMTAIDLNDELRREADLVLVLGSRLGETDWWGKQPNWASAANQKIIQVDLEDQYIGRNRPVELGILADAKIFLKKLADKLKTMENQINKNARQDIFNSFLIKAEKARAKLDEHLMDMSSPMNTAHVPSLAKKLFAPDSIAVFDGGNTAVWGQFFYKCTSHGAGLGTPKMGMLGAGVGQALGAAAAFPHRQVYCIIGDGAFGYHPQEIETAIRNKMNITFFVAVDRQWGMVKINQQFKMKPVKTLLKKEFTEEELVNTNFNEIEWDKVATAMGAQGFRVNNPKSLEEVMRTCASTSGCKVVHIDVDPIKHMWAPGLQTFKKMHDEPKGK